MRRWATGNTAVVAVLVALLIPLSGSIAWAQADGAPRTAQTRSDDGEAAKPHGWQFEAEAYFWGASVGGDTAAGDDIDIGFDDIIDNLNFGLMGHAVARKDKLSVLVDVIYLDLEAEDSTSANLVGTPLRVNADVELRGVISAAALGYTVLEWEQTRVDLIGGLQYLWLQADLDFKVGPEERKFSDSDHVVDGVVGIRGRTDLTDRLFLTYLADLGTGDSDYTWQLWGTLNYRLGAADLGLGYRYLKWKFDDNRAFQDLNIHGPVIGARIRF